MTEDIFIKPEVPVKKKRKLTEKQLENLAKGREKMKLKRAAEKLAKEQGKVIQKAEKKQKKLEEKADKETSKSVKEHNTIKKKAVKEKRKTMKQINKEKEEAILKRLQHKEKKDNKYSTLRASCLDKATSVEEYREIETVLDGITADILHDETKLKNYCKASMTKYIKGPVPKKKGSSLAVKKLDEIKEETESKEI